MIFLFSTVTYSLHFLLGPFCLRFQFQETITAFIRWSLTQFPPPPKSASPLGFPCSAVVIYIQKLNAIQACYYLIAAVLFYLIVAVWKKNRCCEISCAVVQNLIHTLNVSCHCVYRKAFMYLFKFKFHHYCTLVVVTGKSCWHVLKLYILVNNKVNTIKSFWIWWLTSTLKK